MPSSNQAENANASRRSKLTADATGAQSWPKRLARFKDPSQGRSLCEIAVTVIPMILLWWAMWQSLALSYALTLLLAVPAGLFVVRMFMIQHDCSHGAFFSGRRTNDWVGRIIGVLTLTPHDYWRRTHALHHATVGNLDQRGIGDVTTLTVKEYRALGWWGRFSYRLYRNPFVMFGLGPAYLFLLQHRVPVGCARQWRPWLSTMGTNIAIVAVGGLLIGLVGWQAFLLVHVPVILVSSSIGVWLFYVQHQFEDTTWIAGDSWRHADAALHGSSHYDLPLVLRWLTANIGIHHVHHLNSRLPFYRLPEVLRSYPELREVGRVTLFQSLKCVPLALWDEEARQVVSFKTARQSFRSSAQPENRS